MTTEELLGELGELIDDADNALAMVHNTRMALPPKLHVEGLEGTLRRVRDKMRDLDFAQGGEDVWDGPPRDEIHRRL